MIQFLFYMAVGLLGFWLFMVVVTSQRDADSKLSSWIMLAVTPFLVWHYSTSVDLYGDVMRVVLSGFWVFLGFENLRIILGRKPYLLKRRSEAS